MQHPYSSNTFSLEQTKQSHRQTLISKHPLPHKGPRLNEKKEKLLITSCNDGAQHTAVFVDPLDILQVVGGRGVIASSRSSFPNLGGKLVPHDAEGSHNATDAVKSHPREGRRPQAISSRHL